MHQIPRTGGAMPGPIELLFRIADPVSPRQGPLCQTSCRLHRIWPMGALDEGTWLDTVNTSKSG